MVQWIRNLYRKWFRRNKESEAMLGLLQHRPARLVYQQRRNGIEPRMATVRSRKR